MCRGMDVLTIDANRLKIPFGSSGRSRGGDSNPFVSTHCSNNCIPHPVIALVSERRDTGQPDPPQIPLSSAPAIPVSTAPCVSYDNRKDLIIDVRSKSSEPRQQQEAQSVIEIPAFFVPTGFAFFSMALALCNLVNPSLASGVCVGLSPAPMLCLAIHAAGMPMWVALGLMLCGWFLPIVCCTWRLAYCLVFFVVLGIFVAAGTRRPITAMISSVCLVGVLLSLPIATHSQWTGVDSRWGVTVAGFFLALQCISASIGSGRVVYRIKHCS